MLRKNQGWFVMNGRVLYITKRVGMEGSKKGLSEMLREVCIL
jgi:hypothetical protein